METTYYRACLKEELADRCQRNPRYSLRAFAKALNVDVAAVSRILSGKAIPSAKMAQKLSLGLGLSPEREAEFVKSLSQEYESRNLKKLNVVFRTTGPGGRSTVREISPEMFRVIADWYHYAILELTYTPQFRFSSKWIASRLGISEAEAKLAMERLLQLGLLKKDGHRVRKASEQMATGSHHLSTPALRHRQKQILGKAIDSLENDPIEARNNIAVTMAIDPKRIPRAKEMIREFVESLCKFMEGGDRLRVYELGVVLFPLETRRTEK